MKNNSTRKKLAPGFREHKNRAGEIIGLEYRFTINGRRFSVYGRNVTECREKELAKRQQVTEQQESRKDPTLDAYHEIWNAARAGSTKESTLRTQLYQYTSCADVVISSTGKRLGDMRLSEITVQDIREVQTALLDPERASFRSAAGATRITKRRARNPRGVNDSISALSHVFAGAMDERLLDFNPCRPVKNLQTSKKEARETIHRALTEEEEKAFMTAAAGSWYYNVFRFLLATGCRIGEASALTPADISDGMLHIQRTLIRGECGDYHIGNSCKTKRSRRDIPMNEQIRAIIADEQRKTAELTGKDPRRVISFKPSEDPKEIAKNTIFKSPEGHLLKSEPADREIARICKLAGIERFTAHAFRATFATRCNEAGIDPRTVQDILGHSDYSITMNLYTHVLDNTKQAAMEKMSSVAI
ncbi:MAG: site-specific integrase [Bilifractor sp.]|nr:site-specific integrase [Lachnospiraceae bacterium]MDY2836820.1 site-specific integrase [Bilifractor sp.]